MPEGPETWRDAARLADAVQGRVARRVWFAFDELSVWEPVLEGARVASVRARGKAMLLAFDAGPVVVTHNNLYGRWTVAAAGERPVTRRQLRLVIETDERAALLYSASDIRVFPEDELGDHPYLARLGPDALDPEVTADAIDARLDERRFRGRSLGALLLDPAFVSGLGNYLRSEILFEAGLRAEARPKDLDPDRRRSLAGAVLAVTRRALARNGHTTRPALAREAWDPPRRGRTRRRRPRHHVFARAGLDCLVCGETVERGTAGSRRVYWCPRCQPG